MCCSRISEARSSFADYFQQTLAVHISTLTLTTESMAMPVCVWWLVVWSLEGVGGRLRAKQKIRIYIKAIPINGRRRTILPGTLEMRQQSEVRTSDKARGVTLYQVPR